MKKESSTQKRLRLLQESARLIKSGNAGLTKEGKLVDMRKNKNATSMPSRLYKAVRHFIKE
jgi:hypothetical protein